MPQGPSGLEGALPGGDGRALAAYRAEYRGNVIQSVDSLFQGLREGWRSADGSGLREIYGEDAWIVPSRGPVLSSAEALDAYLGHSSAEVRELEAFRNDMVASGEMAFIYGRYEARPRGSGGDQRGVHATVAMRMGRDWKIRAQLFLPLEGFSDLLAVDDDMPEPVHITPDEVRRRRDERSHRRRSAAGEWMASQYLLANSTLSALRHAWYSDDAEALEELLAREATIRLPWDLPRVAGVGVSESLGRILRATGQLHMTILDFEASERLSFCLGRYFLATPAGEQTGYYLAALRNEDRGQRIRGLIFTGAGALDTEPQ